MKRHIQLDFAAEVYRAMNGDKKAQELVTLADVEGLHNAETFEDFIKINRMTTYEQVVR